MIRHVVLVRFADGISPSKRDAIFATLRDLGRVVPGMTGFAAGANVSPEGLSRGYGHLFTVDFADATARDAYLVHPDHQAAGARLVAATEGGVDGLVVLDFTF